MTKVCIIVYCHMALVGIYNHRGTFHFRIFFKLKTPDVKFLLEQSHSIFYLYHIITCNNLKKDHAFATHKS
jgi:hypothetical protein